MGWGFYSQLRCSWIRRSSTLFKRWLSRTPVVSKLIAFPVYVHESDLSGLDQDGAL